MDNSYLRTKCRQDYAEYKLTGIDSNGTEVVVDTISYPVGCSCVFQDLFFFDVTYP